MHGIILIELKRFLEARLGPADAKRVLAKAGVLERSFSTSGFYPDSESDAMLHEAARLSGSNRETLLEEFGAFLAPGLIHLYPHLLKPEWKTLDVIANAELSIHTIVRARNPGSEPPVLLAARTGDNTLVLRYRSPRKMCSMAKGLARGLAGHFGESIEIHETQCMQAGEASCEIHIQVDEV